MATTNPITMVIEAMEALLEASADITDNVAVGNRIKYTGSKRNPEKRHVLDADFPQLRVVPLATNNHSFCTSSSSRFYKTFLIELRTREMWVSDNVGEAYGLFDLEWAILRAMHQWITPMEALRWGESTVPFVKHLALLEGQEKIDASKAHKGWHLAWGCNVLFWFDSDSL